MSEEPQPLTTPATPRVFPPLPTEMNREGVAHWTREVFHFDLDPFQVDAILSVLKGHSCIVSAPTGAGKTVVAEALVYSRLEQGGGVIYTSPIKALSNQKYRDFCEAIGPERVGLVTGDVVIRDDAPFRIMTTEVYRNILLEGRSRLEGISHIIFDEIHYLDDPERGTVWEESLILTAPETRLLALSATIPNLKEFTAWVRSLRQEPVDLILETERPVVLHEHFLVDNQWLGDRQLLRQAFAGKIPPGEKPMRQFFRYLHENNYMPLIYFVFSRNRVYQYADDTARQHNFLKPHEQDAMRRTLDTLLAERECESEPVLDKLRAMLMRGVAYHHAGLRPVYKEVVERLYATGLVKALFATETFCVGVNMPAKSVVFDALHKFDGQRVRPLTYREAQQMSGRAGRRGMDDEGHAFYQVRTAGNDADEIIQIFDQGHDRVASQFSLSYNTLLNLYGRYGKGLYEFSKKSFGAFQLGLEQGGMGERTRNLGEEVQALLAVRCHKKPGRPIYSDYFKWKRRLSRLEHTLSDKSHQRHNTRGAHKRDLIKQEIQSMRDRAERTKRNMKQAICHNCPKEEFCQRTLENLDRAERELETLTKKQADLSHRIEDEIALRLRYLETLGYIEGEELLPRGLFARGLFGYELLITEIYFEGILHTLTEQQINSLFASMAFEARKDTRFFGRPHRETKGLFQEVENIRLFLNREARKYDLPPQAKEFDGRIAPSITAWCEGADFESLRDLSTLDDGDIIRTFRIVADLLRQLCKVITEPDLRQRVQHAMDMIYRDEVDARKTFNL